jgi:flagellar biosynthesis regulator FlbT
VTAVTTPARVIFSLKQLLKIKTAGSENVSRRFENISEGLEKLSDTLETVSKHLCWALTYL